MHFLRGSTVMMRRWAGGSPLSPHWWLRAPLPPPGCTGLGWCPPGHSHGQPGLKKGIVAESGCPSVDRVCFVKQPEEDTDIINAIFLKGQIQETWLLFGFSPSPLTKLHLLFLADCVHGASDGEFKTSFLLVHLRLPAVLKTVPSS